MWFQQIDYQHPPDLQVKLLEKQRKSSFVRATVMR
jgi:hypothetical protein